MSDLPGCSHDPRSIHPFEAREHMNDQWSSHLETLSLTEIVRLQNQLSATLTRRFQRPLVFSDIVGSTAYFSRYGDEAGGRLQQQHFDHLSNAMIGTQGQFFHTAGDGALLGFPAVETAADTVVRFHQSLRQLTYRLASEQQWTTRAAIHWGQVLIDGKTVAGDTVNLCAKVAATAQPGEIRVTKAALAEFPNRYRFLCEPLGLIPISSINQPLELMRLSWHDAVRLPTLVLIEETGQRITLPNQPVISLGRSREVHGVQVNDIALQLTDPDLT
jgi:class 3 adenylate cyclase